MKLVTKLVITALISAVLLAGLGTVFTTSTVKKSLRESISKSQVVETDQIMDKVDRFLYERTIDIQVLSEREQLQDYLQKPSVRTAGNLQEMVLQLNDFKRATGFWNDVTLLDAKGNVQISTDGQAEIASLTQQSQFKQVVALAADGQTVASDVFKESGANLPILLFTTPVRAQTVGRPVIGVAVGELAWSTVLQIIADPGESTRAVLLNKDGLFLGASGSDLDSKETLARQFTGSSIFKASKSSLHTGSESGTFPSLSNPKKEVLGTYEQEQGYLGYKGNAWTLVMETPISTAFAPVDKLARTLIISSAIITALILAALFVYTYRSLIEPVQSMRKAMEKIDKGDLTARVAGSKRDEIGQLGQSFNKMAQGLQESGQKLYEEHARLKASIDSLDIGLLMTFREDDTISYNSILPKVLGLNLDSQESEKARLTLDQLEQKLLASKVDLVAEIQSCQNNGKYFDISEIAYGSKILRIFGSPIMTQNYTIIGAVVLFEDITDAKILERSKDEFFSIASHELRTPLTSIKGNTSMILDYYKDVLKDDQLREMIDDVHTSAVRLIGIVNDFLDLSRLEQGKMNFAYEPTNIEEIIESVVYEMKAVLNEKHIYLKLDKLTLNELPQVWADKNRLKQVVYNLVGNAAKFTEEGGITISAKLEPNHKFVKVMVTDTGRGMTPESQRLLFHKFQQASSSLLTRDTTRGTGLGLYISKMIIESMGGAVALEESIEDKGSIFSFTVPLVPKEGKRAHVGTDTVTDSSTGLKTRHGK